MRKYLALFISTTLLLSTFIQAQQKNGSISGSIADSANKPVTGATVFLHDPKDALVKTAMTDAQGKFEFENLKPNRYRISVTHVGFTKYASDTISLSAQQSLVFPAISLKRNDPALLQEVSVTSRKPFIERKIDRTIINVEARIANAGTNALEVLEIAPGVSVSGDGTISLKGKEGVTIFIDDKPTYLSGENLTSFLRSLPSSLLDKIEIMTNPPAKYDAAGNAGVINIKTKKNLLKGLNGSVTASYGQGVYWRTTETITLNYRKDKLNLFVNGGYSENTRRLTLDIDRKYNNPNGSLNSALNTASINKMNSKSGNIKFGFDHFASKNTTWGMVFTGFTTPSPKKINTTNYVLNSNLDVDSIVFADSYIKDKRKNGSINLNFQHVFDSTGRDLSLNFDYVRYDWYGDQSFRNYAYNPDNSLRGSDEVIGKLPTDINIYSGKADFSSPFKNGMQFQAGLKSSYTKTDNLAEYFLRRNNNTTPDYDKTNNLLYNENINAAYVNISKEGKRFSYQAGLRFEHTNAKGHQLGNQVKPDSSFTKNYSNLFPTAYLSYKLDSQGHHLATISYGKRITRPYYQDLNPFLLFVDKFTYDAGNPYLKPMIASNFELSYTYKELLKVTLMYSHTKDFINGTTERQGDILIDRPTNTGKYVNVGINAELSKDITKWWSCNIYGELVNDKYQGALYGGGYLDTSAYASAFSLDNTFTFKKGWAAELTGFVRTRRMEVQNIVAPFGQLNAGVRKTILKGKGSLRLNVRDVFFTMKFKNTVTNLKNAEQVYRNTIDTRVVTLTFNYRFGKASGKQRNHDKSGADTEIRRVKSE